MNCYECDKELETSSHEYDGEPVCDECWDKFCTCFNCNDTFRITDTIDHNGDLWCEECHCEHWHTCSNSRCGAYVHEDDVRCAYDDVYCERCYDNNFTYVECCDESISNSDVYYGGSRAYCENHYNENFTQCDSCNDYFRNDDLHYDGEDEEPYCTTCLCNRAEDNDTIHKYEHKPRPKFEKLAYENTLFMGIELEVESPKELTGQANDLKQFLSGLGLDDRFYFKWDGSIRDRGGNYSGFEIVSHPATLKWWHQSKAWFNILQYLTKEQFSSFKSGRCGIHVHVNKTAMTDQQQRKLVLFFWNNKEWLKILANRDSGYAVYDAYTLKQAIKSPPRLGDRHVAINLTNENTIEFRIFRGTLNPERFLATLQFVDAVCHFVKVVSMVTCGKYCFREFVGYTENTNRYNHLDHYLRVLDMKHNFDDICNEVEL